MNKPSHPILSAEGGNVAYADDLHGWAIEQAMLLRQGRLDLIDWEHLAEELEGMGQSQYDGLESALRVLLLHLLKWEYQPLFRSRSWLLSIREQHRQYERRLKRNPGLKRSLEKIRAEAYRQAVVAAQAETGLATDMFPTDPLDWDLIDNPPADESGIPSR